MKSSYKYLFHYYLHHRWLRNPFNRTYLWVGQSRFTIPIEKGIGLANLRLEEKWMDKLLKFILPEIKDRYFLDVGVNLGQTLLHVKSMAPEMNYIGFEPNPKCVNYVNDLVQINNLHNVRVISAGLSNKTGVVDLIQYDDSGVDAAATIVEGFRSNSTIRNPVVIMEPSKLKILEKIKLGCIKIDVEGSELEVIEGLSDFIMRDLPFIICEILPTYSLKNSKRIKKQNSLMKILSLMNYNVYRINIETSKLENIKEIEIHSSLNLCNYIFSPANSLLISRCNLQS